MTKKKEYKNRHMVHVNLQSLDITVESEGDKASLKEVVAISDMICRNLGKAEGLNGETHAERVRRVGIG